MILRSERRTLGCLALFLFLTSFPLWAEFQIPEQPEGYVTDRATMLSPETRQRLEAYLYEFEKQTSTQIAVATFPSFEDGSLEDISMRIAQKWKIGQKERNNGVLFLIFRDDRQMRIEVGYGLEGVLTDAVSSQIIRNQVTPYFREGQFENGILSGVQAIVSVTRGEYQATSAEGESGERLLKLILGLIVLIGGLDLFRYFFYWKQHRGYRGAYSFWEWFFLFAILWVILRAFIHAGAGRSGGRWSSGGGGGFSGGGGGSFGGGGASGRW